MNRLLSPIPVVVMVGVLALLGLLTYGVVSKSPDRGIESALASGETPPAPDIRLPKLGSDGEGSLADYRGKVVVLNYWASWCEPCRAESPLLQDWHERLEPRGATVLGVDVLDATPDAQEFINEFGLTYPMLKDGDGDTQKSFGVAAYPETVVIDRRGRLRAIERGPVDDAFFERHVVPLLKEPA